MSRKFALIIGNSEYEDTKLARLMTPTEDVDDLARVLRDPNIGGFDKVTVLINQVAAAVGRAIAGFLAKKKRDDLLLLYFSGHGVLDDRGQLYLAMKDTEQDLLRATSVSANFITAEMDRSHSRRQVLILDCCHSGAFARGAKGTLGASVGTAVAFEGTGYGRVVLTASDSTQYAWEGDQILGETENSLFTHYLIQGLESGKADLDTDGLITLDELYDYVYEQVIYETPLQTPGKWTYKQQGEIVIARNPHPIIKPVELPLELQQAVDNPFAGVREGSVHELERLLRGIDKGLSLVAYEALKRLTEDDSRRVSTAATELLTAYKESQEQVAAKQVQERARKEAEAKAKAERIRREAEQGKAAEEQAQLVNKLFTEAESYLKNKKFEQAIETYKEILKVEPKNQRALSELQQVEKTLAQLAELNSLVAEGKSYLKDHNHSDALSRFKTALKLDPNNQEVLGPIAECENKQRELQKINKLLGTGKKYFENGKFEEALKTFNEIITIDPNHAESNDFIKKIRKKVEQSEQINKLLSDAESYLNKKKFEQAIENYKSVLEIESENKEAIHGLRRAEKSIEQKVKPSAVIKPIQPKKASRNILRFVLTAVAIITVFIAGWYYLHELKQGDEVDLFEQASAAKLEMLNLKSEADNANSKTWTTITYNLALQEKKKGDQEFEAGEYQVAIQAFVEAKEFFRKSIEEAKPFAAKQSKSLEPPVNFGELQVTSVPSEAEVLLNGQRVGKTPYSDKNVKVKDYELQLSLEGYQEFSQTIKVRPNELTPIEVSLNALTGGIKITSKPSGASIFLNGEEVGTTPYSNQNLKIGTYEIVLRKEGYENYSTSKTLKPNQVAQIEWKPTALTGGLKILVQPYGSIYIDEERHKKDIDFQYRVELPVGKHTIKAVHSTFGIWEKQIKVEPNKDLDIKINFNKQVKLTVASIPVWGDIFVDIKSTGLQTPKEITLRVGQHIIEVRREGYEPVGGKKILNLENDLKEPLVFELKKKQ